MALIAASVLSADFARLGAELAAVEKAGADWVHVDIMDGHFVPNLTMGPLIIEAARKSTRLPIDAHLLIEEPDYFVESVIAAGATYVSVHAEVAADLPSVLNHIRALGARPGIALGPAAPLSLVYDALELADFVDLLAVNPGFGGQEYQPAALGRIADLGAEIRRRGLDVAIQSDGGINPRTIAAFAAAGVDVFVVGSALFGSPDYARTVRVLRLQAEASRPAAVRIDSDRVKG
jgi:ribulose-phosphate 3-epimerase